VRDVRGEALGVGDMMQADDVAELVGDQVVEDALLTFAIEDLVRSVARCGALEDRPSVVGEDVDPLDQRHLPAEPLGLADSFLDVRMELMAQTLVH
jgi:hypothetical protein